MWKFNRRLYFSSIFLTLFHFKSSINMLKLFSWKSRKWRFWTVDLTLNPSAYCTNDNHLVSCHLYSNQNYTLPLFCTSFMLEQSKFFAWTQKKEAYMFYSNGGLILHTNSIDWKSTFLYETMVHPSWIARCYSISFHTSLRVMESKGLTKADDRLL